MTTACGKSTYGLALLALFLFGTTAARAGCDGHWNLSGAWRFVQSNGYSVDLNLSQNAGRLTGSGKYKVEPDPRVVSGGIGDVEVFPTKQFGQSYEGQVSNGTISGNIFSFSIKWTGGAVGQYTGTIDDDGFVAGLTYDRTSPDNAASWSSDGQAICALSKPVDPDNPKKLVPRSTKRVDPDNPKKLVPKSSATKPVDPDNPKKLVPRQTATVTADVDLYDEPGGEGEVIGMLPEGAEVSAKCREDQWCSVRGDEGQGWVWGEFLAF